MSQRINITISDELFKRLQGVKEKINVSGVCQEAIARAVKIKELATLNSKDMNKIVSGLRVQKKEYDVRSRQQGFEAGLEQAKSLLYEELLGVADLPSNIHIPSLSPDFIEQYDLQDYLEDFDDSGFNWHEFLAGWIAGVKEFWGQIKDKL